MNRRTTGHLTNCRLAHVCGFMYPLCRVAGVVFDQPGLVRKVNSARDNCFACFCQAMEGTCGVVFEQANHCCIRVSAYFKEDLC